MTLSDHPDRDERMYRDYLWDGGTGLEFSKIPTSLVGWGKKKPKEGNILKWLIRGHQTRKKLILQPPTLSCSSDLGVGDGRFTARAHRSGHRALVPFRALDSFPEPPETAPRIPESPAPKNHQWPPGSLGSRVNAALPPPLPGPVERRRPPWPRLSCGCGAREGPLGAAALGTAPPPLRCP